MKLFQGLPQTDYQDILRALGRFIDENQYIDVRIIESEDGLIFQGRPSPKSGRVKPGPQFETFLITDDDLRGLLKESYARRGGEKKLKRLGD
ncbi:MAG: hypothetical protein JXA37_14085 [Chloroflexia bacterium]|nr:hypothetical protein [Chloroflexia bacterium]